MRLQSWNYLKRSWDRADSEKARLEKATSIFFEDVARDDWLACSKLIERGCSPNMALGHKRALMVAAESGAINTLRLLASTGADLGAQDEQGRDALFWAIETRADDAVDFLLAQAAAKGVRPKRLFDDNSTALIAAAKLSYVHAVRALVHYEKSMVNMWDRMGRTALWHVLSKTDLSDDDNEIARILMDGGADPSMRDLEGVSAREAATSDAGQSLLERHDIEAELDPAEPSPEQSAPAPSRRPRL